LFEKKDYSYALLKKCCCLVHTYMKGTPREDSDIDIAVISSAFKGDRYSDRRLIVPWIRQIWYSG